MNRTDFEHARRAATEIARVLQQHLDAHPSGLIPALGEEDAHDVANDLQLLRRKLASIAEG